MSKVSSIAKGLLAVTGDQLIGETPAPLLDASGAAIEATVELPVDVLKGYLEGERSRSTRGMDVDALWRQRARFCIAETVVKTDPRLLLEVLRGVFVFRCEFIYSHGCFEYEACSEHWPYVPHGHHVPWYHAIVHTTPTWRVEWKRRDDNAAN